MKLSGGCCGEKGINPHASAGNQTDTGVVKTVTLSTAATELIPPPLRLGTTGNVALGRA